MALSYNTYTGDGSNAIFSVAVPYLNKADIHVYVDMNEGNGAEEVAFEFLTAASIRLNTAPAVDSTVVIRRTTPIDKRVVDYKDGSALGETEMDRQANQLMYMMQEAVDSMTDLIQLNNSGDFDGLAKILTNLAPPVNDTDAATKAWVEEITLTFKNAAEAARDLALTHAGDADTARAAALVAQAAAELAQGLAETAKAACEAVQPIVITEGDNQVGRVTAEGDTQVGRVVIEGDTQVGRVTAEGDTQTLRGVSEADRAASEADRAVTEAERAKGEADRASLLADSVDPSNLLQAPNNLSDVGNASTARTNLGVVNATTGVRGLVELATNAEALAGTDTERVVTSRGALEANKLTLRASRTSTGTWTISGLTVGKPLVFGPGNTGSNPGFRYYIKSGANIARNTHTAKYCQLGADDNPRYAGSDVTIPTSTSVVIQVGLLNNGTVYAYQ